MRGIATLPQTTRHALNLDDKFSEMTLMVLRRAVARVPAAAPERGHAARRDAPDQHHQARLSALPAN